MRSKASIYSIVCSIIIVLAFSIAAFTRNFIWHDELSIWKRMALMSPYKSRPFNSLGVAYAQEKMYDEAIKNFKTAIRNGSGIQEIHHYNLGLAYQEKGLSDEARLEFQEAIRLKPDYADARYKLGLTYKDIGILEKAESELKKAVEYAPDRDNFHNALGNIYLLQKKYNLAVEEYKIALRLNAGNVEPLYNLAIAYDEMRMREDAIRYYRDFIRTATPEYQDAKENARQRLLKLL